MDNVAIDFDTKALELIATIAQKRKVGARALRSILEDLMLDIMFKAPTTKTKSIKITTKEVNTYIKEALSKDLQEQLRNANIRIKQLNDENYKLRRQIGIERDDGRKLSRWSQESLYFAI